MKKLLLACCAFATIVGFASAGTQTDLKNTSISTYDTVPKKDRKMPKDKKMPKDTMGRMPMDSTRY